MTDRPNIYYERTENGKIQQEASRRLHEWCLTEDRNRLIRFKQLLLEETKRGEGGNTSWNTRRRTVEDVPIPRFDLYMLPTTVKKKIVKRAKVKRGLLKGSCTFVVQSASGDVRKEEDGETPDWQKRIDQYLTKYRRENLYTKECLAETNVQELRKVLSRYTKDGQPIEPLTDSEEEKEQEKQEEKKESYDQQKETGGIQVSSITLPKTKHPLKKKKKKKKENSVKTIQDNDVVSTAMPVGHKKSNFSSLPDLSVKSNKSKSSKGRRSKRLRIAKPNFVREILNREECQAWHAKYTKEAKNGHEMGEDVKAKEERSAKISFETKLDGRIPKPVSFINQGNELRKSYRIENRNAELKTTRAIPAESRFYERDSCDVLKPTRKGEYIKPHITPIMPLETQLFEKDSYGVYRPIRREETREPPKVLSRFRERESYDRVKPGKKKYEQTANRPKEQGDMLNSNDFLSATPIVPLTKPTAERKNRVKDLIGYHETAKTQYKQRNFLDKKPSTRPFIKILEQLPGEKHLEDANQDDAEVTEILPPQFTDDDHVPSDNEVIICGYLGLKNDPRKEFNIILDEDTLPRPNEVRKTKRRSASTLRRVDSRLAQRTGDTKDRLSAMGDSGKQDVKSFEKNLDGFCRPTDLNVYYSETRRDAGVGEGKTVIPTPNEVTDLLHRLDISTHGNHTQPYQLNSDHDALRTKTEKHGDFASSTRSDYVLDGGNSGRNTHHKLPNDSHNISRFTSTTHECGLFPPADYQQRLDRRARELSRNAPRNSRPGYNDEYLLELASKSNTIQLERQLLDAQSREQSCQTIGDDSLSSTRCTKWTGSGTCGMTTDYDDGFLSGAVTRCETSSVDTSVDTSDHYPRNDDARNSSQQEQNETSGFFDNDFKETPHCNSPIYGRTEININEGFEKGGEKSRPVTGQVTNIVFGEEQRYNSREVSRDNIKIDRYVKLAVRKPPVHSISIGTSCDGTTGNSISSGPTVSREVNQMHKHESVRFHSTDGSKEKATRKFAAKVQEKVDEKPAFQYKLVSSAMLAKTVARPTMTSASMKLSNNTLISRNTRDASVGASEDDAYHSRISSEKSHRKTVGVGDRNSSELPFRVDGATSTDDASTSLMTSPQGDFPKTITPRNYGLKWYKKITPYPPNDSSGDNKPNVTSTGVGTTSDNIAMRPPNLTTATRNQLPMSYNKHKLRHGKSPTNIPGLTNLSNLIRKPNPPPCVPDKVGDLPPDLNAFYQNSLKRGVDPNSVRNPNVNTKKRLHWTGLPLDPVPIVEEFNNFVKHESQSTVTSGSGTVDVENNDDDLTIDIHSSRSCTDIKISCKELEQLGVINVCDRETQKIIDMRRASRDKNRYGPAANNTRKPVNAGDGSSRPVTINYKPSSRNRWKVYENR